MYCTPYYVHRDLGDMADYLSGQDCFARDDPECGGCQCYQSDHQV